MKQDMMPLEMLHAASCMMTRQQLSASQVAVLATIAKNGGCTRKQILDDTHISEGNFDRIVRCLLGTGDISFKRAGKYRSEPRRFYVTDSGRSLLDRMISSVLR